MILGVSETFYIRDIDIQPLLDRAEAVEDRVVNDIAGRFVDREFARDLLAVEEGYGIAVESQVSWEVVEVFRFGLSRGTCFARWGGNLIACFVAAGGCRNDQGEKNGVRNSFFMVISFEIILFS